MKLEKKIKEKKRKKRAPTNYKDVSLNKKPVHNSGGGHHPHWQNLETPLVEVTSPLAKSRNAPGRGHLPHWQNLETPLVEVTLTQDL